VSSVYDHGGLAAPAGGSAEARPLRAGRSARRRRPRSLALQATGGRVPAVPDGVRLSCLSMITGTVSGWVCRSGTDGKSHTGAAPPAKTLANLRLVKKGSLRVLRKTLNLNVEIFQEEGWRTGTPLGHPRHHDAASCRRRSASDSDHDSCLILSPMSPRLRAASSSAIRYRTPK
jgi:hypothetical protein